jgi:acetyl esterase
MSRTTVLRKRAGAAVFGGVFRALPRFGRLHPRVRAPHRYGIEVLPDVAYGPLPEQRLDVVRPAGAEGLPVVLYLHGGAFRMLSKETHRPLALRYARHGWVVFNADYRLGPRHRYPAAIEDACEALAWVHENAARYGGDPHRIVIAGESAGGNLTAALTLCTSFRRPEPFAAKVFDRGVRPRAAVPIYGIFQVSDCGRFSRRKPGFPWYLQDRLDEVGEAYLPPGLAAGACELADPVVLLERGIAPDRPLPPFFAPVGTADPLLDDTRRLAAALERHGARCEARYYPGEVHAFHVFLWRPNARACWTEMLSFMTEAISERRGS